MKLVKLGLYFVIFILCLQVCLGAIYLGTCEGYVFFQNGSLAPDAFVEVDVSGCSDACSGNYTSDVGGYYVVANLNMEAGDNIDASATLVNHYGDDAGTADAFQAAYVNITMCAAPSAPILINVPADTHNNSYFSFEWTSGVDPSGAGTYDQFLFDGTNYNDSTSPQTRENLVPFKTYSWGVRTCNDLCCSDYNMSSFDLENDPPPQPILTDQPNTDDNDVSLSWVSGGADPDGDSYYFDYRFDGVVSNNVTSPQNESGISGGGHTWCVRACDDWECSNWACDSFSVVNDPPSDPVLVDQGNTDADSISLTWTSGIDPNGDLTYDQLEVDGVSYGNVTSPQIISLTGTDTHTWRIRTCDVSGACSSWVSDSFIRYECPVCPAAEVIETIIRRGGGGGGLIPGVGKTLFVSVPAVVGDNFIIRVGYESSLDVDDLRFEVESPVSGIIVNDFVYGDLERDKKISIDLKGSIVGDLDPRIYGMTLLVYDGDDLVMAELFDLNFVGEELPAEEREPDRVCDIEDGSLVRGLPGFREPRNIIVWAVFACLVAMGISGFRYMKKRDSSANDKMFKKHSRPAMVAYVILVVLLIILFWFIKCYG